jgi:hypothetical protein
MGDSHPLNPGKWFKRFPEGKKGFPTLPLLMKTRGVKHILIKPSEAIRKN